MSELYPAIKHLHMLFAMVSLFGFLVRSGLKFSGSALLDKKLVKILPHVNDTLLLVCGILLAAIGGFNPFTQLWLLAKILLLVAYIGCGLYVLKWSNNNAQRVFGVLVALACFGGMGVLAVAKPF
jgi:uncharacterized membrane protein SirB2